MIVSMNSLLTATMLTKNATKSYNWSCSNGHCIITIEGYRLVCFNHYLVYFNDRPFILNLNGLKKLNNYIMETCGETINCNV